MQFLNKMQSVGSLGSEMTSQEEHAELRHAEQEVTQQWCSEASELSMQLMKQAADRKQMESNVSDLLRDVEHEKASLREGIHTQELKSQTLRVELQQANFQSEHVGVECVRKLDARRTIGKYDEATSVRA